MTFTLGDESYGIPVLNVREIIRLCPITPVPRMPTHVKGVINLRGTVIAVLDLRAKFQLTAKSYGERTCGAGNTGSGARRRTSALRCGGPSLLWGGIARHDTESCLARAAWRTRCSRSATLVARPAASA